MSNADLPLFKAVIIGLTGDLKAESIGAGVARRTLIVFFTAARFAPDFAINGAGTRCRRRSGVSTIIRFVPRAARQSECERQDKSE